MSLIRRIGNLKGRLPLNGDWLFVTASMPSGDQIDAVDRYQVPDSVLKDLSGATNLEAARLIYERAKAYESTVADVANRVYDKSKVIFGAASFASTVLLALGSTLLPPLLVSAPWLRILGVTLAALLFLHLIRSIVIAAEVMTRESFVRETPQELVALSGKREVDIFKELTAKIIAYSSQTQTRGLEKLNRLIFAQHSFRYALIYFFALTALSSIVRIGGAGVNEPSVGAVAKEVSSVQTGVETLSSRQETLVSAVERLEKEHALAQRELRQSLDLRKAELDVLRAIETQLRRLAAGPPPPSAAKGPSSPP